MNDDQLAYLANRKYSAEFYSHGEAVTLNSIDDIQQRIDSPGHLFLALNSKEAKSLPSQIQSRITPLTEWKGKRINLYVEKSVGSEISAIEPITTHLSSK